MHVPRIIGSLLLLAATGAAAADDPDPQQVQITGPLSSLRQRETTTSIVVSHEDIIRQGDQTLADVLKRLPGISISGAPGQGGAISMRGLGNGYAQIMLNGEPVAPGFSLDSLPPEIIERIEILRSATAQLSNQAVAGSINIVLRKTLQRGQRSFSAGAARQAGVSTPSLAAQVSDSSDGYSYTVAATLTRKRSEQPLTDWQQQLTADGATTLLRRTQQAESGHTDALTLAPRLNWTLSSGDTLTWQSFANLRRVDNQNHSDETAFIAANSEFPHSAARFAADFSMVSSDLNWLHLLQDGAQLELKLGARSNRRSGSFEFIGKDASLQPLQRHHVESGPSETSVTASGTYRRPVSERHALALGWDASSALRSEDRNETLYCADGTLTGANNADYSARVLRLALFAQDEWEITERYWLYLGLRHERLDTASRATASNAPDALDSRAAVWSPSLQSRYQLNQQDLLRLALSRSYKAPQLSQLVPRRYTNDNNNNPTNPDQQGNPKLRPELAWGLDAAYEHYLGKGALLSISAYLRRIRDVTQTRLFQQDGAWIEAPFNDGNASVHGVEMEAKLPLTSALDLRANLARNWSRLDNVAGPDNRLEGQTPFTANLGADYRPAGSALTFGGSLNYQAGSTVRQSPSLHSGNSAKRELDLYLLWKSDAKTQLRIAASNLLRQQASATRDYTDSDGLLRRVTLTPTSSTLRIMLEHQL